MSTLSVVSVEFNFRSYSLRTVGGLAAKRVGSAGGALNMSERRTLISYLKPSLDIIASVSLIAAAASVVWMNAAGPALRRPSKEPAIPAAPLSLEGAALKGAGDAPVVLLEFSDFECSFCATFANEILPAIEKELAGGRGLQFAVRHLPLPNHRNATKAAEIAECARRQEKFWPFYSAIFGLGGRLDLSQLTANAQTLNQVELARCLATDASQKVAADVTLAKSLGISVTPTFLIGLRLPDGTVAVRKVVTGTRSASEFIQLIRQVKP